MGKVNYLLLDMSVLSEVYVKVIEAKGYLQSGEEDNTVRIMSIHKSKGLEFPVVFLAGMGKK